MSIDQFLEDAHRALLRNEFVLASNYMRQAEELEPENAQVQSNMSYLAYLSGDLDQALHKGHRAVLLDPENIHARINYGNALRTQGDVQAAIEHLEFVITKNADSALAWTQLNLAYQDQQQITKAIAAGRNAIRCDPRLVHGYSNLALTLQQTGRVSEAARLLEKALSIEPTVDFLHKNRLMNQQYLPQLNSRELIETAQRYGETCHGYCQLGSHQIPDDDEPIRIGILSGDFRYHPVGWFLLAVLKAFAPNKTHITLYANQQISDGMTCDLEAAADGWRDIHRLVDSAVIEQIQDDNIEILIDLAGHTAGSRLNVFAQRAAPFQASWLGYFASTGIPNMDYAIFGEDQLTAGSQSFFTERLLPLKGSQFCYSPPDYAPDVVDPPCIKNKYITFGCFNNPAKINSDLIQLWARILDSVEGSQLILKSSVYKDTSVREYFRGEFDRYRNVSGRIEFRSASTHADMLAEYADVDIALDPFPFSGALTSCEALWMGVPIVTLCQIRPVSRQTMGILKQLGLDKYSTQTPGSYLQVARELAGNVDNLTELRHSLRERMLGSPLTDGLKMAIALEKVFHRIAREKPRSLTEGQSFSRETMSSKYAEEPKHKQY